MDEEAVDSDREWRTAHEDLTDEEWELIENFFPTYSRPGTLGRPAKWTKRDIVNGILYVLATGCQWRALPKEYPHWNTIHRYHRQWSTDGTWAAVSSHVTGLARLAEGRDPEPSAGVIDSRSVQGASTVTGETRGYDAAKKISGRKVFAIVDTLGLLLAVAVVAASTSENAGGIEVVKRLSHRSSRLKLIWSDQGFKKAFAKACRAVKIVAKVVVRTKKKGFEPIPRRWVVERTFSWIINQRRLKIDYERKTSTTEGFIWAAQTKLALRRLT